MLIISKLKCEACGEAYECIMPANGIWCKTCGKPFNLCPECKKTITHCDWCGGEFEDGYAHTAKEVSKREHINCRPEEIMF
ncbi:MAG: hypothetical protein KBT45_01360 [Bacteroidales bacterium]|nr:hypothetical protein [Candidatus Colimorpha pelethequi]